MIRGSPRQITSRGTKNRATVGQRKVGLRMHSLFAVIWGTTQRGTETAEERKEVRGKRCAPRERCNEGTERERRGINRYRDTVSRRKPTSQQLLKGPVVGVLREDGWNAPRTGRKAADIPKFATASKRGTCPIVPCTKLPWPLGEGVEKKGLRERFVLLTKVRGQGRWNFLIRPVSM